MTNEKENIGETSEKHRRSIGGSVENRPQRYTEKDYKVTFSKQEEDYLKFISTKLSSGKRVQELETIRLAIEKKANLMNYLKERIDFYLSTSFHHVFPEIQIKKMKRRWGACFYQKNRVCFNLVLAHIDYALIDYVIVHELCHFLEANHSKAFYHEIEKRMPDYKERERLLKDVGI